MARLTSEQRNARRTDGKFGHTRTAADDQTAQDRAALVADTLASVTEHGEELDAQSAAARRQAQDIGTVMEQAQQRNDQKRAVAPFDPNDYLNVGFDEIAVGMQHPDWDEEAVIEAQAQNLHARGDYRTIDQLRQSRREGMDTARWVADKRRAEQAATRAERERVDSTDWDQTFTDELAATDTARQQLQELSLSNPPTAGQTEAFVAAFKAVQQHQKALVEAAHIVAKRDDPDNYDYDEVQRSLPVDHDRNEDDTLLGRASVAVMYLSAAERTSDPVRLNNYYGSVQGARDGRYAETQGQGWPCPNCANYQLETEGEDYYCSYCDA